MLKTSKDERKSICILGLIQSTLKSRGVFPLAATDVLTWGSFDASYWHKSRPARPQNPLSEEKKVNFAECWFTAFYHGSCLSGSPRTVSTASLTTCNSCFCSIPHVHYSFYTYTFFSLMAFKFFLTLQILNFVILLFNLKVTYETRTYTGQHKNFQKHVLIDRYL